jgi:catechol 2,3-dioxygenase-like lactoylglutathione lyase family enzyme
MKQHIGHISLLVDDYDRAIEFYTKKLRFILIEDSPLPAGKRWVLVAPQGSAEFSLLLAKASGTEQESRIGDQTGGRVFLFLYTEDFKGYYQYLLDNNISIVKPPVEEAYGTVAVFKDIYGNLWDLIQKRL